MTTEILLKKFDELRSRLELADRLDSYRLLHGRGRCFESLEFLNIDFYQPVLLLVLYREPPSGFLDVIASYWAEHLSEKMVCVLVQRRYQTNAPSEILLGNLPAEAFAQRGDLRFHLHLNAQQNSGFFLDMEAGRQWIESHARGKRILNLFAYSCAFSVIAVAAGAEKVVNVDMSSSALNLGRANHQLSGLPKAAAEYVAENILKSWSRIKKPGPYDIVIIDPPSFQKGSFVAEKDYAKIIRRLPELMPSGGLVLACLNAPELGESFLKDQFAAQLPQAEFVERLKPHPDFPNVDQDQQLKLLIYKVPASLC